MEHEDIFQDVGFVPGYLHEHPENLVPQEAVSKLEVEPLSFTERAVINYDKHRRAVKGLGGVMLGGLGFAAGAVVFAHRTAH